MMTQVGIIGIILKINNMSEVEILTSEIVDQSYQNALGLLLGNLSFKDLEERGEFYLPEDYETCILIRDNKL